MLPLVDQLYVVCGAVGSLFIIVGFVMGQMHEGHADIHMDSSHDTGGDFSGADDAGGSDDGGDFSGADGDTNAMIAKGMRSGTAMQKEAQRSLLLTILKVISPTTIAIFLCCFGFSGIMISRPLPFLGWISIIPALFFAVIVNRMISKLLGLMVRKLHTSSNYRVETMIGHMAEATCAIPAGKMGEISYRVGSVRHTAPARAKSDIPKMAKVVISDIEDGIFYVEPSNYELEA